MTCHLEATPIYPTLHAQIEGDNMRAVTGSSQLAEVLPNYIHLQPESSGTTSIQHRLLMTTDLPEGPSC